MKEVTLSDKRVIKVSQPRAGMLRRALNNSALEGDRAFSIIQDCTGLSIDELDKLSTADFELLAAAVGKPTTPSEQ